ncbi:MAG: hypothetical protein QG650_259 [Patescibacteria group bacterium]|nr:hypothetical protein [Patescibacteria group bacterium]
MVYTTITNIVKNGKREFSGSPYKTVLSNNRRIGMVLSPEMAEALEENGILDQVREELWELHDEETRKVVEASRVRDFSGAISFDDFIKSHAL